ncbi:MAG: DUF2666 family protein [archaeon]|jgi:hypothetical protein
MAEESIQFIANFDKFVSIKKLTIDKDVLPTHVIEFLASVEFSTSQKIKDYLGKICDIKKFEEKTKSLMALEIGKFIEEVNSNGTKKIIKDFLPSDMDKKEIKDAYTELFKVYLIEKYAIEKGVSFAAHHIVFPANKKLMKVKK